MMRVEQLSAVVLFKKTYKEYDELVWLFTEEYGITSVILHGSKRKKNKYGGELSLFSYLSIELKKRSGLSTLYNFQVINRYYQTPKELMNLYLYGSEISELLRRVLIENQTYTGMLNIIDVLLKYIAKNLDARLSIAFMQKELLQYTGMYLEFNCCAICRTTTNIVNFSYQSGGVICQACNLTEEFVQQYSISEIKVLVSFYRLPIDKFSQLELSDNSIEFLSEFWMDIYNDHLGITLKSDTVRRKLNEYKKEK